MEKVSIIVPVYNSEKYIEKCVESIINQTYKNIELILINDGSKDSSLNIIKNLSKKYSIIKYYNQDNQGVSKTRNNGIKYASGKYIMFIDNDDYIDTDYVETFVKEIEKDNFDYIIGGYKRVDQNGKILLKKTYKNSDWSYYMFVTPWGKIFNKEFLINNKIEYLKVKIGEDIYFNTLAISYSKKRKIIDYAGYNWLYNIKSVSNTVHKKNTKSNKEDLLLLYEKILNNINKNYLKNNENYIKYFFLKTTIWYTLYSSKQSDPKIVYESYIDIKNYITNNIANCYKKMISFNPKGESISTKTIIIVFIILDKIKLLKPFLKLYSKI